MNKDLLSLIGIEGYRDGVLPPEEFLHVDFYDGGLGDHICRLPALKYLIEKYPFVSLTVGCPKFFVDFGKKAIPEIKWLEYDENKVINMSRKAINAGSSSRCSSLRTNLVDHAFQVILDKQVSIEHKNYLKINNEDVDLSKFNLPDKYVIITTGYTAKVRELKADIVNELADCINKKGYKVVFLGNKKAKVGGRIGDLEGKFSNEIDFSKGLDLRDKTSLIEAHAIIAKSKTILGLDNGLLHLAGCTDVPIIMGFTTVSPELRIPTRRNQLGWEVYTVTPDENLKCRFCQSNMNFVFDFDFRKCYYVENRVDKEIKCVTKASAKPYMEHLEKLL